MTSPLPTDRPLISAAELDDLIRSGAPRVVLDCGFDLADVGAGERAFAEGHLPGALYVHLDRDASGPKTGTRGRHPLPDRAVFAERAGRWGISPGVPVVTYDAQGGPYAARVWWLLRWLGHDQVAVLDGGRAAWLEHGGGLSTGDAPPRPPGPPYPARPEGMTTVDAGDVLHRPHDVTLIDARAPERFRGEVEPLDPVAGRIPGAVNRFHRDNLGPDGRFKPVAELRQAFAALGVTAPARTVHQCGSGVTACHNLLAMEHAGLRGSMLYPGSWSEWCADPSRPVARD